jgi:hypothetical protein
MEIKVSQTKFARNIEQNRKAMAVYNEAYGQSLVFRKTYPNFADFCKEIKYAYFHLYGWSVNSYRLNLSAKYVDERFDGIDLNIIYYAKASVDGTKVVVETDRWKLI